MMFSVPGRSATCSDLMESVEWGGQEGRGLGLPAGWRWETADSQPGGPAWWGIGKNLTSPLFSSDSRCRSTTISVVRILTSHWAGLSPSRGPRSLWIRRMG